MMHPLQKRVPAWTYTWISLFLLCAGAVHAQTTYVHDANGRVVAVTQSDGTTQQYTYDTLGHVAQVSTALAAGQLAIFAFTPVHGVSGTQVAIEGQGFSSSASSDAVSFNGTAATVVSSSATQLVADVPSGATSGPISVTVAGQTVTSASSFVVDDASVPPSITQVTPTVVQSGGTVTVTGAHLDPAQGATSVQMGGVVVQPSSVSDTQLQFAATNQIGGYITVQTPYGQATSPTYEVVVPSTFGTASVVSSAYASAGGSAVNLNTSSGGQLGVIEFNGTVGSWVSLQASNIVTSASNVYYKIYAPNNVLIASGTVSSRSPSIFLPQLTTSGTYLVVFQPDTAGAQLTLQLQADTVVTLPNSLSVTASVASQSKRYAFAVPEGANLELEAANVNVTGGNSNQVTVTLYGATGNVVASFTANGSATNAADTRQKVWNLAQGSYSVVVSPTNGGTISANMVTQLDTIEPGLVPNTPVSVNLALGQVDRFTFSGTAGANIALDLSGTSTTPGGQNVCATVYAPGIGPITLSNSMTYVCATSQSTLNLPNLPTTGTYTVVVEQQTNGNPATTQLTLATGTTGIANGTSQSYATTVPGQNVYLSFTVSAGQYQELELTNINSPGGTGNSVQVQVYNASGGYVTGTSCSGSTSPGADCRWKLWNLAAGTYSIVITPSGSTSSFNVLLQPDITGPTLSAGTPATVTLGSGQVEWLTFSGTAGENAALNLSGVSTTPSGQNVCVTVYSPSVGTITTSNSMTYGCTNSQTTLNLSNLPATGTYTAVVEQQTNGVPATAQLTLGTDTTNTVPSNGTSQNYAAMVAGQNIYLNFSTSAGQYLELELTNVNSPGGSSNSVQVQIYNASGGYVTGTGCSGSTSPGADCRLKLWNLAAGTYSIIVAPGGGGESSFNVLLQPDVTGQALTAGTPATVALGTGQVEWLTFSGTAGETVALDLSSVSTTPSGQNVCVTVYSPSVGTITTSNSMTYTCATSQSTLTLSNLPATGTYTAVVEQQTYGFPATAQLTLTIP